MRADMRELITFKSRNATQNDYGEETQWADIETVFASAEPILGNEFYTAESTNSRVQIKFRCWYFDGVTNQMRVAWNGADYDILSAVNYKSLNREWLIYASKVVI